MHVQSLALHKLGVAVHTWNPRAWEVEMGIGSPRLSFTTKASLEYMKIK